MTNEEAIKYLKQLKYDYNPLCPQREALRLAIRALEEEPKGEWIEDSGNIACSHCHTRGIACHTIEPNDCVLKEFGKCSYKETGCSDCKIKSNLRYMCHGSAWKELQALREFKEKHDKKGKWEVVSTSEGTHFYGCSECQFAGDISDRFCRRCGADMRGDENA